MGDQAEYGAAMQQARKDRHQEWYRLNMEVLNASGLMFGSANRGEALLFRDYGKPKADFYPSTGRWRSGNKTYSGGAKAFLAWWKKQAAKECA
jgi:hypothetical protein